MTRWVGALICVLGTGLLLSFLLALGERSWFQCFAQTGDGSDLLAGLFASGDVVPVLLETLTPPFGHWALFLLHYGAGIGFALALVLARTSRQRRALWAALALFFVVALWMLVPVSSQHDCDRKGTNAVFLLMLLSPLGYVLALGSHVLFRPKRRSP